MRKCEQHGGAGDRDDPCAETTDEDLLLCPSSSFTSSSSSGSGSAPLGVTSGLPVSLPPLLEVVDNAAKNEEDEDDNDDDFDDDDDDDDDDDAEDQVRSNACVRNLA